MPYQLCEEPEQLEEYLDKGSSSGLLAIDTETSSLDTRRARIAGFSLSLRPETGIYVPLGHKIGKNLEVSEVWPLVERKLETEKAVFHNAKYDMNILQVAAGAKISNFIDTLELIYLEDPDRKTKGLKSVAKSDLGFDMAKFESLFTASEIKAKKFDIRSKHPARCVDYACSDADATLRIAEQKWGVYEQFKQAVTVDMIVIDEFRKVEHNGGLLLNEDYIDEQIKRLEKLEIALKEQIQRIVGVEFEINSPKQLGDALFERMGLPSPGRTASGNHITKADSLEKLAQSYPIAEFVVSYRKVVKAKGTYFVKLKKLSRMGLKPRFNFNLFSAPTFRFSAPGGDPLVDGATGVNIQAVSNGEVRKIQGVDLTSSKEDLPSFIEEVEDDDLLFEKEAESLDQNEQIITSPEEWGRTLTELPWVIGNTCIREICSGCVAQCSSRGVDTTRRVQDGVKILPSVRQAFRAPEGYKVVSFDYDRQELVIGANLSKEPKWLKALAEHEDLHAITASTAFGMSLEAFQRLKETNPEEYSRRRGIGKIINFAIFYGASAYTISKKADISKMAGEQIFDSFVRGHPVLMGWIKKVHIFARKTGYTTTYFGRKRSLEQFYNHSNPKMHSFADRSAVNTCIQGTAAEVTRIAIAKTVKNLERQQIPKSVARMVMQIHDELVFIIKDEHVDPVCNHIRESMEFKVPSWEVQLTVGRKVGQVWGDQKELDFV